MKSRRSFLRSLVLLPLAMRMAALRAPEVKVDDVIHRDGFTMEDFERNLERTFRKRNSVQHPWVIVAPDFKVKIWNRLDNAEGRA